MNLANRLTLLRLVLVPLFVLCFYLPLSFRLWIAAGIFLAASITDVLDGRYARKHDLCTDFGRLMDPIADKVLVSAAFIMLSGTGELDPVLTIAFVAREFVISGFRLVAAGKGVVLAAGTLGKLKTTLQCVAVMFLLLDAPLGELLSPLLPWAGTALYAGSCIVTGAALVASLWSMTDYLIKNKGVVDLHDR